MIQHVWSVLCQNASFDAPTNRVSLFNTLESLIVIGTPTKEKRLVISCEIVSLWVRQQDDVPCSGQMRVRFDIPGEETSQEVTGLEIDLTKTPFHRTRITVGALPLAQTGRFEFQVEYHLTDEEVWHHAATLPFIVSSQKPEDDSLAS